MKFIVYAALLAATSLTVPWFFTPGSTDPGLFGLPIWVTYALFASLLYAILIACILHFGWNLSAGDNESNGEGPRK